MEKSRRGRRPKKITTIQNKNDNINETPIIAHLPIDLSDVINDESNDIFIRQENDNNILELENKMLKKKIEELSSKLNKQDIIKSSIIVCSNNSKCWWCKYSCNEPMIQMPETYYNGIFSCSGYFCSWDCMMAYNIDMNDMNVQYRTSLIYMMYQKTYGTYKIIKPAPSWKILTDFGGPITIEDFRNNLIINDINYNYIKPPMISRISYVEKIPNKKDIDIIKNDELVLKRTKPLKTSKYSLETMMGLKKIINTSENN
jgi:hypothetical protein